MRNILHCIDNFKKSGSMLCCEISGCNGEKADNMVISPRGQAGQGRLLKRSINRSRDGTTTGMAVM